MPPRRPSLVVLAGPNGSGKSTMAPALLQGALRVNEFVDADTIARGLSAFDPTGAAFAAGSIMLARMRDLAERRVDFAFETTLAARSLAPWIRKLKRSGYRVCLLFLWLPTADFAVQRVATRVQMGGHDVPEATVRRRHERGLRNFFRLYQPLADEWQLLDNSSWMAMKPLAAGKQLAVEVVHDERSWLRIRKVLNGPN